MCPLQSGAGLFGAFNYVATSRNTSHHQIRAASRQTVLNQTAGLRLQHRHASEQRCLKRTKVGIPVLVGAVHCLLKGAQACCHVAGTAQVHHEVSARFARQLRLVIVLVVGMLHL